MTNLYTKRLAMLDHTHSQAIMLLEEEYTASTTFEHRSAIALAILQSENRYQDNIHKLKHETIKFS